MTTRPQSQTRTQVTVFSADEVTRRSDRVVTEEPLEMRLSARGESRTIAVTMRTPGADFELASGFLFAEGIVTDRDDIVSISYCRDDDLPEEQLYNIVIVEVRDVSHIDLSLLQRHFHVSSACGVCGKSSLEAIELRGVRGVGDGPALTTAVITSLPDRLRESQRVFESTGGLHAAALFTATGEFIAVREDVGRHNAVDKLVGWCFLHGRLPLANEILMVSGRSSFEIAQKAVTAGIPVVCSVSAPSSLAVDVARRFGMTLIGFLRDNRFNVYAGRERFR
ncbi:MAG: formate dehydrogenase accessory sulfurtransferase FdhD [Actinobacteria bacterium]|nr:formate dehydrogenase accessory sulfurtransferase FdhD [Actinomycetota bacterium]